MSLTPSPETPVPLLRTILRAIGWCGLGLVMVAVFVSDFLAPAPAGAENPAAMLSPPSDLHPLGTDLLGRDMLSETLHGLAQTGGHALVAALVAIVCGGLFGSIAARLPKPFAFGLRGVLGVFAAVPALLLTILVIGLTASFYAPLAAGLAAAPLAFVRAFDRVDAHSAHAEYARATGIPTMVLLRRDLSYEFREMLASVAARALAAVTIILSTASFLGFGAAPPARDLGLMIAAGKATYLVAWWTAAFPAAALIIVVLCARLAAGLDEGERP